jgi:hypothetical protein
MGAQGVLAGQQFSPWASMSYSGSVSSFAPGGSAFLDVDLTAAKSLVDTSLTGSLDLSLALSRLSGTANYGLRLDASAALPDDSGSGVAAVALSFPLVLNGSSASLTFTPKVSADILDSGYAGGGVDAEASFMVGDVVLKPGLGLGILRPWTGGLTYSVKPLASAAWYPGFPLTVTAGAEFLFHVGDSAGSSYLSWGFDLMSVAAPAEGLLLTLTLSGGFSPTAILMSAELEVAPVLARGEGGKEWSLPLECAVEYDGVETRWLAGIGLRSTF